MAQRQPNGEGFVSLFCSREVEKYKTISANFLYQMNARMEFLRTTTPEVPDENKQVREDLKKSSQVRVFNRLVKSPHFAHNKFVVFCDRNGNPEKVWTGSTNWTVTGLCTQTNNGILINDADIAAAYKARQTSF
jgi:phosphatidylserine/phosphatidylglycerophosphate/cardiolipin synthase-like enzyme